MNILPELFITFSKIGAFTFGGGYAMISLLDNECVEKKHWITSDELMDVTVVAESTPGPIAINCATYTGYKKAGLPGAVVATMGIVLPSFFIILIISAFFENLLSYPLVANAFKGIRIAVAVLIIQAAIKMIKKMLKKTPNKPLSIGFVAVFFIIVFALNLLNIHFSTIYLILISGFLGFFLNAMPKRNGVSK